AADAHLARHLRWLDTAELNAADAEAADADVAQHLRHLDAADAEASEPGPAAEAQGTERARGAPRTHPRADTPGARATRAARDGAQPGEGSVADKPGLADALPERGAGLPVPDRSRRDRHRLVDARAGRAEQTRIGLSVRDLPDRHRQRRGERSLGRV